jgi:TolA-binding protein
MEFLMRLQIVCFVALLSATSSAAVAAQDFNDPRSFTVTGNFSIQMPLDNGAQTADMAKAIAQLSQQLGDLANRECDVLSAAFKADCHVIQLNMGTNVNERRSRRPNGEGGEQEKFINANVQTTFALTPSAPAPTAPAPAPTSTP